MIVKTFRIVKTFLRDNHVITLKGLHDHGSPASTQPPSVYFIVINPPGCLP